MINVPPCSKYLSSNFSVMIFKLPGILICGPVRKLRASYIFAYVPCANYQVTDDQVSVTLLSVTYNLFQD